MIMYQLLYLCNLIINLELLMLGMYNLNIIDFFKIKILVNDLTMQILLLKINHKLCLQLTAVYVLS